MSDAPDIVLNLPLPPSANRLWRKGRGGQMHKSQDYQVWLTAAGLEVAMQRAGDSIPKHFHVRITLPPTRRDPDNSLKPTLDLLQASGAIANDKHATLIILAVDPRQEADRMRVDLWAVDEPEKPARTRKLRTQVPVEPLA